MQNTDTTALDAAVQRSGFSHRIHRSSFQVPFIENAISLEDRGVKCPVGCELATNIANNQAPLCPFYPNLSHPLKTDERICEG